MRENPHFIRSTDLSHTSPTLLDGRPAFTTYRTVIDRIEQIAGRDAAALFAEPVLPRGGDAQAAKISWYCAFDGSAVALGDIDEAARRPIAQKLQQRTAALAPALNDADVGRTLAAWLNLPSERDILAVGGEPVLINWGFLPSEIVGEGALREVHFARTLGRYAPALAAAIAAAAGAAANTSRPQPQPSQPASSLAGRSGGGTPPAPPPPLSPRDEGRSGRPWLAPLIAVAIAVVVLGVLLIPGVLIYPERDAAAHAGFEEQRLRASNESLEAQLKALQEAGRDRVCRAADAPIPVPLPPRTDGPPNDARPTPQMEIVPREPERVPAPRGAEANPAGAANIGELLDNATVLVFGLKKPQGSQQGTGFFISDRHIVTNHHVVFGLDEDNIFVASRALDGIRRARLVARSRPPPSEQHLHVDLAVLEIAPEPNRTALRLGKTPAKLSTTYVAGFPGFIVERDRAFGNFIEKLAAGLRQGSTDETLRQQKIAVPGADLRYGRINNIIVTGEDALPIVIHDMQLAPGNSGGPLIDACGRVGGVNTLLFTAGAGPQQANVAQDVSLLRRFLADNQIAFTPDDAACDAGPARSAERGAAPPPPSAPPSASPPSPPPADAPPNPAK